LVAFRILASATFASRALVSGVTGPVARRTDAISTTLAADPLFTVPAEAALIFASVVADSNMALPVVLAGPSVITVPFCIASITSAVVTILAPFLYAPV